ncbi:MAG TPA: AMP-binding protein [Planctomycetota bacterium]|nr:AMP-binding protein [Planctomycetota bacterium]
MPRDLTLKLERSYLHRGGSTPLIGKTLDAFLREVTGRFADREAIISLHQGLRLTYAALDRQVEGLAKGLMAIGIAKGDRVGIWATDNAEWVVLQLATARVGAVLVNVNPAYRSGELEYALRYAKVQTLFLVPSFRTSDYPRMLKELWPSDRVPQLTRAVVYDPAGSESTRAPEGFLAWQDVFAAGTSVSDASLRERSASLDPDDPINIQFTSGTTGFPKGVVLTHHNILNNGFFVGEVMRLTERDRLCVPVPFYHCFGMVVSSLACLTHGAALVIPAPHFEAGAILAAVEREKCTVLHGVPTMFVQELEHPEFRTRDLRSLRTGIMAGAPCPPELVRRVIEEMGIREILIGYGQTEASPVTHCTRPDDSFERRVNTVGTSLDHQEVKVVDAGTGRVLPVGEPGEVCFRGYHVMRGYFEQEQATRKTIDEAGWLHSGDLGVMDEEGYVRITGRIKDMIARGGEKIFPAEIEAFYFGHPKIAEIAVFGVPDRLMGEEVAAWIKLREGATAEPEEFREYARGRIAHYKIPKHVWIVTDFPMTVTGKIQKFRMREIAREKLRASSPP